MTTISAPGIEPVALRKVVHVAVGEHRRVEGSTWELRTKHVCAKLLATQNQTEEFEVSRQLRHRPQERGGPGLKRPSTHAPVAVACVALYAPKAERFRAHTPFGNASAVAPVKIGLKEQTIEMIRESVSDDMIRDWKGPQASLIERGVGLCIVRAWRRASSLRAFATPRADGHIMQDAIFLLIAILKVQAGAAHVIDYVLLHCSQVCAVDNN